jgi:3-oxoacyl-(acyl-carrier-protein) synthase
MDKIAITGIGLVSSLGKSPAVVSRKLLQGKSGVKKFSFQKSGPEFIAARISSPVTNQTPNRWPISRATALALAAAGSLMPSSPDQTQPDPRLGLIHGTTYGNLRSLIDYQADIRKYGLNRGSPMQFPNTILHAAASFLSLALGAAAFNVTLSNDGISGTDAIETARNLLSVGAADRILVVTSEAICPELIPVLQASDDLEWQFPDPFGEKRGGYAPGEAAVAVLLEPLTSAQSGGREIHGIFRGSSGVSHCTQTSTAFTAAMRTALADAGVSPEQIGCVVANGNGSKQDGEEASAIYSVFGKSVPVTSVKGAFGECVSSSFLLSLVSALMCAKSGYYPLTMGRSKYDSKLPPINLLRQKAKVTTPIFMVNAFTRNSAASEVWSLDEGQG